MRTSLRRRAPCILCAVALGGMAALATAQERVPDVLSSARAKARAENQRVLLLLNGGSADAQDALDRALRGLGKLVQYEYQLAAQPATSVAGAALRKRFGLQDAALPLLAVLDTEDRLLGSLQGIAPDGAVDDKSMRAFLEEHRCAHVDANEVLATGIAEARRTKRHAFVYLSAPW